MISLKLYIFSSIGDIWLHISPFIPKKISFFSSTTSVTVSAEEPSNLAVTLYTFPSAQSVGELATEKCSKGILQSCEGKKLSDLVVL